MLHRMHDRLAGYEQDERFRTFIAPLTRKTAALHRRILEQRAHLKQTLQGIPRSLRQHCTQFWAYQMLDGVRVELETTLADFGVEPFTCEGDRFDRTLQEAVQRVASDDPARAGRIVKRLAPGFRMGERVIVAERVTVFVKHSNGQSLVQTKNKKGNR